LFALFQNGLKPISIDNVRDDEGGYQLPLALACGGMGFFQNGLKPVSIKSV